MNNPTLENMYIGLLDLVRELEAVPLELPEGLALLEGEYKGARVCMRSQAWQSPTYRLIRYTGLVAEGRLHTFNAVLYPHHCYDAPIFATDWVVAGDRLRIGLIDAMPLFPQEQAYHERWVVPFEERFQQSLALAPAFERKLSWSTRYLGPAACLATGLPARELEPLAALWKAYLRTYLYLTANLQPASRHRQEQVAQWHASYNQAHLAVEDQRNPYMVYFGKEAGQRYNRDFLFSNDFGAVHK